MKANLSILPEPQKELLFELKDTPSHFVLYGGTAIALRLGHRVSVDFDFFSCVPFDPSILYQEVLYLKNSEIVQIEKNTLTCLVNRNGPIRVSFFGDISLKTVLDPDILEEGKIKIASLIDLSGMKMAVIQKGAAARDYIDIEALLTKGNIDLITALAAASIIYGSQFNPNISLKALVYFKGGDLSSVPETVMKTLLKTAKNIDLNKIPERIAELKNIQRKIQC